MTDEFLTVQEAADLMEVSRFKIWLLIRDGKLSAFQSELDLRQRLVRRADLEALMKPTPVGAGKGLAAQNLAA